MAVVKLHKINELITSKVAKLIKAGYTIKKSEQTGRFPEFNLVKGRSKARISVVHNYPEWQNLNDVDSISVIVEKDNELIENTNFYQVTGESQIFYTNKREAQKAEAEIMGKLKSDNNELIPITRKNVRLIREIPGWKTVAKKNMRLRKRRNSFVISNATNNHETIINLKK